jgi:polysaccharide export outer membrane protein
MKSKILILPCLFLLLVSCKTPKDVAYFQGIENVTAAQKAAMEQTYKPRICSDDILVINVTSPDVTSAAPYNLPAFGYYSPGEAAVGKTTDTQKLYTYLVDEDGFIQFPYLGRIHIAELSINEANRMLEEKIRPAVPDVMVNVQIVNYKVSIFGEVKEANVYEVKGYRVSILDLIAMAGDLTINADRKNVLLVRDNNGKKETARLDLTKPDVFSSPYYYLQQNDLVYVEPNDEKKRQSKYTEETYYSSTMITGILSSIVMITSTIIQIIYLNKANN